jgi:hypothetical protein
MSSFSSAPAHVALAPFVEHAASAMLIAAPHAAIA